MHYYLTTPHLHHYHDGPSWSPPIDRYGDWSTIYLTESCEEGAVLVASDHRHHHPDLLYLGDELDFRSLSMRKRVANRLRVTLQADTLRGIITELLLVNGPTRRGGRFRAIQTEADGWHRIYLRGLIYEAPAMVAATYTEAFTRSSDENLEASANWSLVAGTAGSVRVYATPDTASVNQANSAATYRYENDTDAGIQYSELELTAMVIDTGSSQFNQIAPAVSMNASAATFLMFTRYLKDDGGGDTATHFLQKSVNVPPVTRTGLNSETTLSLSLPETIKVTRNGATVKGWIDDVEKESHTLSGAEETAIPATTKGGLYSYSNYLTGGQIHTIDNWAMGDWEVTNDLTATLSGTATVTVSGLSLSQVNVFTLIPDGDQTGDGTVINELGSTTNTYLSIDDDPDSPDTTDYVFTQGVDGYKFYDLSATPGDLGSVSAATVRADINKINISGYTVNVYGQIFDADELTNWSDEVVFATEATSDGLVEAVFVVNATGLAASKAEWDTARVKVRWDFT